MEPHVVDAFPYAVQDSLQYFCQQPDVISGDRVVAHGCKNTQEDVVSVARGFLDGYDNHG